MKFDLKGKSILVTGACGTVGSELVRQLLDHHQVGELTGIDNNESDLFLLEEKLSGYSQAKFYLADIRDRDKMARIMQHVDVVFHTAAFKHVYLCERSPFEAIQTNILGVHNIVNAAFDSNVERVVFTSSDKAVNPTNVMGTSKLMGERLMTAAHSNVRNSKPIFTTTRFGNVLGSRGSVIPLFRNQIRMGKAVTLTDPGMTRFIMSLQEAVQMVIDSALIACGGEVLVTKMPVIRIRDLAEVMIQELAGHYGYRSEDIPIQIIGAKPGEKMYEELMNIEETRRVWELSKYFTILPAFKESYRQTDYHYSDIVSKTVSIPYHSANEKPLSKNELAHFLRTNHLLLEEDCH